MSASACRWARRPSPRPELAAILCGGRVVVAGLVVLAIGACSSHEDAKKVLGRIDRMRDTPLAERGRAIEELEALKPRHEGAVKARRACLDAYQKLQAAHDRTAKAKERLDALAAQGQKPRFEEVSAADEASTLMIEARKAEPACVEAVAALRRALR